MWGAEEEEGQDWLWVGGIRRDLSTLCPAHASACDFLRLLLVCGYHGNRNIRTPLSGDALDDLLIEWDTSILFKW